MRNPSFLWIIFGIMLLLDIYIFQTVKYVLPTGSPKLRITVIIVYWLVAVIMLGLLISFAYLNSESWPRQLRTYILALLVAAFFSKIIASVLGHALLDNRRWTKPMRLEVRSCAIAHLLHGHRTYVRHPRSAG